MADRRRLRQKLDQSGAPSRRRAPRKVPLARATVPPDRLVQVVRCLCTMFNAGVPIHVSLAYLAETEEEPFKAILADVVVRVEQGARVSRVLAAFPRIFPPLTVAMLEVGEATGRLGFALEALADYVERSTALRQRLVSVFAYPVLLLVLTAFMSAFLLVVVFPQQQQLFVAMDVPLPGLTRLLMGVVPAVTSPAFFGFLLALGLTLWLGRAHVDWLWHEHLKPRLDAAVLELPVLGPLVEKIETTRMLTAIRALIETGVQLSDTELAAQLAGNTVYRLRYLEFLDRVKTGEAPAEALEAVDCFPPLVRQLFAVGAEQGSLPLLMRQATRLYEEDLELALLGLVALAEPAAIAFMSVVMGTLMLATFLPMVALLGRF